jgi:hypothetical protein
LGLQISNQGADAAFATLSPHLTGAVRDTTIVEHAEIPIHSPAASSTRRRGHLCGTCVRTITG